MKKQNDTVAWIFVIITLLIASYLLLCTEVKADTGLLLAKSCVGEAGFESVYSNECAAIMHIYKKRAKMLRWPLKKMVRKYSAAVKHRKNHPNRWVLCLNRKATKPCLWPKNLSWQHNKIHWMVALDYADEFLRGNIEDPTPNALHFGGRMDRHNLSPKVWERLKTEDFLNYFYMRRR